MSAWEATISRRLLLASGAAIGLGLNLPATAQSLEKVTYLFPAPPILPAFGPIQLAQGKGYFKEAGLEVSYAVGRGVEYYDRPVIRRILKDTRQADYRWSSLILKIVESEPFRMRRAEP